MGLIDHFFHRLWVVFLLEIVGSITPFSMLFFLSSDFWPDRSPLLRSPGNGGRKLCPLLLFSANSSVLFFYFSFSFSSICSPSSSSSSNSITGPLYHKTLTTLDARTCTPETQTYPTLQKYNKQTIKSRLYNMINQLLYYNHQHLLIFLTLSLLFIDSFHGLLVEGFKREDGPRLTLLAVVDVGLEDAFEVSDLVVELLCYFLLELESGFAEGGYLVNYCLHFGLKTKHLLDQ